MAWRIDPDGAETGALARIAPVDGLRVIELGCGDGRLTFRYAGETFEIPREGWIELIADRRSTTYRIHDRSLPLDVWPTNQFGFREVPLPSPDTTDEKETTR